MLKYFFILCLAFAIICEAQSQSSKRVPIVEVAEMTDIEINNGSSILKDKGDGLLQWASEVKEGENDIMIYAVINGADREVEELCKGNARTTFPPIVKQFLGVKSCPIKKDTLTYLSNIYTKPGDRKKGDCEDAHDLTVKLINKKNKKEVLSLDFHLEERRLDECTD